MQRPPTLGQLLAAARRTRTLRLCGLAGAAFFAALAAQATAARAQGAATGGQLSILVAGDSYSAGNGAGDYFGAAGCWRSHRNYAESYARLLAAAPRRQRAAVTNVACSGATTGSFFTREHGRPPQLDAVNNSYDVIFLTVGGNDIRFAALVKDCLIARSREGSDCLRGLDRAMELLNDGTVERALSGVLSAIRERAPNATIVLLGYPYLEGDRDYALVDRREGERSLDGTHCGQRRGQTNYVLAGRCLYEIADLGETIAQRAVANLNARDQTTALVFVSTKQRFAGHELFAGGRENPRRWFIQPFKDAFRPATFYHPNPTGWEEEAKLLLADPRVPEHPPFDPGAVTAVTAGLSGTCALLAAGTVKCWGANYHGQLGDGTTNPSPTPVAVAGLTGATAVSAGDFHTCAAAGGGVVCWGFGENGQLGDGDGRTSLTPVPVLGAGPARSIAAGGIHTCAALVSGRVTCWGWYGPGQLGDGTHANDFTATPVQARTPASATAVGAANGHSCARLSTGRVVCWGNNSEGQLGNGRSGLGADSATPVPVRGIRGARDVAVSGSGACAVLAGGRVACWGASRDGQLGTGSRSDSPVPVRVRGVARATRVAGGFEFACALLTSGNVRCWGGNSSGQLGDGTTRRRLTPVTVRAVRDATGIAAGSAHACAVLADGGVKCWGENGDGQLGDGTTAGRRTPVAVTELR